MRHTYRVTYLFAMLLALAACSPEPAAPPAADPPEPASETDRFNAWINEQSEQRLALSPTSLTFLGRKDRYGELDDLTAEALDAELAWFADSVETMVAQFDRDALDAEARTSFDLWAHEFELEQAGAAFRADGFQFDQMNGAQSGLPTFLINMHRVEDESDARAYVSRIREAARVISEQLDWARRGAENGWRTPDFALQGVIEQAGDVITGAPFDQGEPSGIWGDFLTKTDALAEAGTIDAETVDALRADAESALRDDLGPAWQAVIDWAEAQRDRAPEVSTGIHNQPNGEAYYAYLLRRHTTTDLSAQEVHDIGLAEVARLRAEMDAIREEVGFEGSLRDFFDMLRDSTDDERFYFPDTDEGRQGYIDEATAAIDRIEAVLPEYFGLIPQADLVVKRVEAFRERDGAAQHYYPSSPDGSRPGVYYAHLSDMTAMPKRELEVIAYHEGLPGHHMQVAIAMENDRLPLFRKMARSTAYSEGWALYSEWLAQEMPGTYQDPYSRFGRLGSEMWRAVRLVVDTGLHAMGWTEDEAHAYFLENAAITDAQARSEVQRYIVMPGQATAYKIGMLEIQRMRAEAEATLGDAFDIRGFHDVILGGNALPMSMLDARVDRWVQELAATAD